MFYYNLLIYLIIFKIFSIFIPIHDHIFLILLLEWQSTVVLFVDVVYFIMYIHGYVMLMLGFMHLESVYPFYGWTVKLVLLLFKKVFYREHVRSNTNVGCILQNMNYIKLYYIILMRSVFHIQFPESLFLSSCFFRPK